MTETDIQIRRLDRPNATDAELAGSLAKLMDGWEVWRKRADLPDSAANLVEGMEAGMEALVHTLVQHGVKPPDAGECPKG